MAESLTSDIDPSEAAEYAASQGMGIWRNEDIDQLEKRLLLKIEASRWALERDRLLKTSADFQSEIEPRDHALLTRARELTNCYLWMNNPETAPVIASDTYEMLADAYAAAAACVGFMRELIELMDRSPKSEILSRILRDALYITATAQSALRRVTYDVSGREDQDQIRIHRWLTVLTKRYSIYVNRHMKKDSLAPKERIYVIPEYVDRLRKEVEKLGQRQKILTEGFRRIQYHASRIQAQTGTDYDWTKIIETVDELVDAGIPANDPRFEESFKGILDSLKVIPSYKEHPFFINVLMELDYWRENAAQKAIVEQELSEMPPQPSNAPASESAEAYASVWDEMERSIGPGKLLNEDGQMTSSPEAAVRPASFRSFLTETSGAETPRAAESPRVSETVSESAFAGFSASKKAQGFGVGILTKDGTEPSHSTMEPPTPRSPEIGRPDASSHQSSPYSRFSAHRGIPSYASVVSEKATHHDRDAAVPAPSTDEMLTKARKAIQGKTVVLVDGEGDAAFHQFLQKELGASITFAAAEQIASEAKLAQLVHPGSVALVLMVEGSVPASNRNVENYCRHFDKPLLRVGREREITSVARQIIAALTLWR